MDKNEKLTKEQKLTKDFIRVYVKIMLYVPFAWILGLVIFLIVKGFMSGFTWKEINCF